jgi:Putative peptidoglycan binding domain
MTLDLSINSHSKDPQPHPSVREAQWWLSRKVRKIAEDGVFGEETRQATISFQKKMGFLEVDGVIGSKTWHQLSYSQGGSQPSRAMATGKTGRAIKELGLKIATGKFFDPPIKIQYVFGAENDIFHPEKLRQTDCSELWQTVVSSLTGKAWVDGSWNQYGACTRIPVSTAMRTPGAFLFITDNGGASGIHHVAGSVGDGVRTIEARSAHTTPEVGVFSSGQGRFQLAGTVPGFTYDFPPH